MSITSGLFCKLYVERSDAIDAIYSSQYDEAKSISWKRKVPQKTVNQFLNDFRRAKTMVNTVVEMKEIFLKLTCKFNKGPNRIQF